MPSIGFPHWRAVPAALLLLIAAANLGAADGSCDADLKTYDAQHQKGAADGDALLLAEKSCRDEPRGRARVLFRRAMIHYETKNVAAASDTLAEALRVDPGFPQIYLSQCGALIELKRFDDAIATCVKGLEVARAAGDGSETGRDMVTHIGFNLVLARLRSQGMLACFDDTKALLERFSERFPEHGWAYQLRAGMAWDCDRNCPAGLALYQKSCALGHQAACRQLEATPSCDCEDEAASPASEPGCDGSM